MYRMTFEVMAYDMSNVIASANPDSLANVLYSLNSNTIWIQTIDQPLKHGDQFTIEGEQAAYIKKLYVDVPTPTLKIIQHTISVTDLETAEEYTEDTPLELTAIVVSDPDREDVTVTLTLSNHSAGTLNTATSGSVTSTYYALGGVWTANGPIDDINTLLAGLTFTPASEFSSDFTIDISVSDDYNPTITGTKEFTGTAADDAPIATNLSAPETYTQSVTLNLTNIVVSDVDSANVIATLTLSTAAAGSLTTATSGTVTSTYNAGTGVWTANGPKADVNTLLAGVSFVPALGYSSSFTIGTSVTDGTSTVTGTKAMTGVANSAPVLDNSRSPTLSSIARNSGAPSGTVGTLVSSLIDAVVPAGGLDNVMDANNNTIGIAVTAADSTNGSWFYSINNGTTWNALGAVSDSTARLLSPSSPFSRLYFQPTADYNGTIASAITFRAWDQTSGTNGSTANTSSNGGSTAFSSATDTASLTIT